uniref:Uncharacterized protein n=1 Tax=Romanomermis culicivorax TaxID=13658 RepID=A0A915L746_ROMCU
MNYNVILTTISIIVFCFYIRPQILFKYLISVLSGTCSQWSTMCRAASEKKSVQHADSLSCSSSPHSPSFNDGQKRKINGHSHQRPIQLHHHHLPLTATSSTGGQCYWAAMNGSVVVNGDRRSVEGDSGKGTSSTGKLSACSSIDSLSDGQPSVAPFQHGHHNHHHPAIGHLHIGGHLNNNNGHVHVPDATCKAFPPNYSVNSAVDSMPNLKRALQAPPMLNMGTTLPRPSTAIDQSNGSCRVGGPPTPSVREKHATIASLLERQSFPSDNNKTPVLTAHLFGSRHTPAVSNGNFSAFSPPNQTRHVIQPTIHSTNQNHRSYQYAPPTTNVVVETPPTFQQFLNSPGRNGENLAAILSTFACTAATEKCRVKISPPVSSSPKRPFDLNDEGDHVRQAHDQDDEQPLNLSNKKRSTILIGR